MAMKAFKKVCCCYKQTLSFEESSHSPSEQLLAVTSFESLTKKESSLCRSMNLSITYDPSLCERNLTGSLRVDDGAQDIKQSPLLECFIIPSFGEDPPDNVAAKLKMSDKMASNFLKGVEKDFDIIQRLINKDGSKQLRKVKLMCHFAKKKVEEFIEEIGDAMKDLKLKPQKGCKYNTCTICTYMYMYNNCMHPDVDL